tara:strand:+ start:1069 stop:1305 length:237 start_codon:yes stop_codon:yes gene_type:complete
MTSRVYYHSWITGPQGARFEIFKSNHSTEVINETKKRLRYDQDVVKIYLVKGEPEDYDHKIVGWYCPTLKKNGWSFIT